MLPGNVENFIGVAQVPIGLAGPLRINGEHARGDFYIPLATSEGTLVASYNRGMRLLSESGGVKTTVVGQYMQRSPAFFFDDALVREICTTHVDYVAHGAPDTTNATDSVAPKSGLESYLLDTARMTDGAMLASKTIVVRSTLATASCAA